jgi:hypothetical protein
VTWPDPAGAVCLSRDRPEWLRGLPPRLAVRALPVPPWARLESVLHRRAYMVIDDRVQLIGSRIEGYMSIYGNRRSCSANRE